jgi:hypothetical protein
MLSFASFPRIAEKEELLKHIYFLNILFNIDGCVSVNSTVGLHDNS